MLEIGAAIGAQKQVADRDDCVDSNIRHCQMLPHVVGVVPPLCIASMNVPIIDLQLLDRRLGGVRMEEKVVGNNLVEEKQKGEKPNKRVAKDRIHLPREAKKKGQGLQSARCNLTQLVVVTRAKEMQQQ